MMADEKVEKGASGGEVKETEKLEKERAKEEVREEPEKPKEKEGEGKTALDVLKEAHEKGIITEEEYEKATHKLLKRKVEGTKEGGGFLVGEIKIIEREGIPEIFLERGELEIPTSAKLIKKGKEILVRVGGGVGEKIGIKGGKILEGPPLNIESEKIEEGDEGEIEKTPDLFGNFNLEKEFEAMDFSEERKVDDLGEVKDDIELIDLKKEFQVEEKGEEEEAPSLIPGMFIFQKVVDVIHRKAEESEPKKLKRYALENLEKIKQIKDEKRAIVGIAYVLKGFLEVRFKIPHELTYSELISEIKGKDINEEIKDSLLEFFKYIPVVMYAKLPPKERFSKAYTIAEKTIKELT